MALNEHAKRAQRDMIRAVEERGANCFDADDPSPWTGVADENGVEWLPSEEEAARLCEGCPLLGRECHEWWSKSDVTFGVLDGRVVDKWKISGVDLFAPTEEEAG